MANSVASSVADSAACGSYAIIPLADVASDQTYLDTAYPNDPLLLRINYIEADLYGQTIPFTVRYYLYDYPAVFVEQAMSVTFECGSLPTISTSALST